jgi:hypothetical protein
MAVRRDSITTRKQFASVIEQDDAVAQQAPALAGLIRHNPCCQVIGCRPFRAPWLMLTHVSSAVEQIVERLHERHPRHAGPLGRVHGHACRGIVVFAVSACELGAWPGEPSSRNRDDFCL